MKKLALLTTLAVTLFTAPMAMAHKSHQHDDNRFEVYARVTHVEPIYRSRVVHRGHNDCRPEGRHHGHRAAGSMILGGIAGSAIAGEIHNSPGSRVAGAVVGSAIGHDIGSDHHDNHRRCRPHSTREHRYIDGYRVHYRHHGRHFVTQTKHHPGKRIRVNVSVEPGRYRH